MCTLVLAWRVFDDAPVAVAANRDEALDRPSSPPTVVGEDPRVLAPSDERAGGTWIGYNEHGVFVGLTNRWTDGPDGDRSRGLLVRDALAEPSAEAAVRRVERELDDRAYAPFHLVVADEDAALVVAADGRRHVSLLEPGVHVVVNVGWDGRYETPSGRESVAQRQADTAERVRTALQPEPDEGLDAWLDRATSMLADHEVGACVHGRPDDVEDAGDGPPAGFGTVSSSVVVLGGDRRFEFADGPPCETPYRAVEEEL